MNRDFPLAPTFVGGKEKRIKRLEKREEKLVSKANKAVDEGRDRKADRLFGRAAKVEDRKIRLSERKR
jgi:phage shock protein A